MPPNKNALFSTLTPFEQDVDDDYNINASDYVEQLVQNNATRGIRHFAYPSFSANEHQDTHLWAPSMVPIIYHPKVVERGPKVRARLLRLALEQFMRFTYYLEMTQIAQTTLKMAAGIGPLAWPAATRRDAMNVVADEAYHAECAARMLGDIARVYGPVTLPVRFPASLGEQYVSKRRPAFMQPLEESVQSIGDPRLAEIARQMFCVTAETLFSKALYAVPADMSVHPAVRMIVKEHCREEMFHFRMFGQVMGLLWEQLSSTDKDHLAGIWADYIQIFLLPDIDQEAEWLSFCGFVPAQAYAIAREVNAPDPMRRRDAAKPCTTQLKRNGVLDHPKVFDTLAAAGILDLGLY